MGERATPEEWAKATIDDIAADPHKYGAPTFAEFSKDLKKFTEFFTEAGKLALLDKGPNILRKMLRKQIYVVNGIKCNSPERAEVVAREENIDLRHFTVELIDIGNGQLDQLLIFNKTKGLIVLPTTGETNAGGGQLL